MKYQTNRNGFSLIELMVVVAIVAILVALALPSYTHYVRKANRTEAQKLLVNWANNQELWRATHATYADNTTALGVPTHDKYTFTVSDTTAQNYLLTATAKATDPQAKDTEKGQKCDEMTLNQSNAKAPTKCW